MAHGVVLTWSDTDAGPGVGYNVYRGVAAGAESATSINATPIDVGTTGTLSFTDTNVVAGQTYYYTVRATLGGVVSAASSEVSATVPLAVPTGLTASAS
jgi:hypothetical protein